MGVKLVNIPIAAIIPEMVWIEDNNFYKITCSSKSGGIY